MFCVLLFTNRECSQKRRRTCSSSYFSAPRAVIITAGFSVTTLARHLYQDICIFDWHACTLFCWFDYWLIGSALRLHIIHDTEHNFSSEPMTPQKPDLCCGCCVVVLLCERISGRHHITRSSLPSLSRRLLCVIRWMLAAGSLGPRICVMKWCDPPVKTDNLASVVTNTTKSGVSDCVGLWWPHARVVWFLAWSVWTAWTAQLSTIKQCQFNVLIVLTCMPSPGASTGN